MRPSLTYSFLAAALLVGACKQTEQDSTETTFQKPRGERKTVGEQRTDAIEKARNVTRAEEELARARAEYKAEMTRQLVRIDERLAELDAKHDEKSREIAKRLRAHRDEFAAKLERLDNAPPATWEHLKRETDEQLEQMNKDSGEE